MSSFVGHVGTPRHYADALDPADFADSGSESNDAELDRQDHATVGKEIHEITDNVQMQEHLERGSVMPADPGDPIAMAEMGALEQGLKAAEEFLDFFGKETNLTVSGQLEAESLAMGLGNVYTFGPTFRAENSNTSRHLAEFWMI